MRPLHLLTVIGARPQIIKAAAISRAIAGRSAAEVKETLLHTGQHYDANMSKVFFDELGIPRADIDLGVGSGPHGVQTARMIEGIEQAILMHKPDVVLLYGDTNSTLAGSVAAAKLHVPVAHVEAGLRSFNMAMPEEINRIVCDHCSTWLFCPTATAVENLRHEGFDTDPAPKPTVDHPNVVLSGDIMYDNSMHFAALAGTKSTILLEMGIEPEGFVLATVHRDNNTDDVERLTAILSSLLDVHAAHKLPVVLPLHPRTRKRIDELVAPALRERILREQGVRMIPPVGFLDMISLERHARLVLTDSGGVQKESYFFSKPCVILRPETEWVELVAHGQAVLADADPQRIRVAADAFLNSGMPSCPPLFGDGHASERIIDELLRAHS
ncbi:MAG: UDP-N-acetylglucosamine 2-epimerase (non-hydrolyzing) [Flavobacteriales bacterium]